MIRTLIRHLLQYGLLLSLSIGAAVSAQTPGQKAAEQHDVIRINVFQNPDLSLETRVSEQGQITYPLVGAVQLNGLSVSAAEQRIAKALRDGKFVLNPQVNILLMQVRSAQVSILGQVSKPGRYPIDQVGSKVSEMIAAAGGVVPGASDIVTLTGSRNGRPVRLDIDLPAVLQAGKTELDPAVQNGDILSVDRAPHAARARHDGDAGDRAKRRPDAARHRARPAHPPPRCLRTDEDHPSEHE